MSGRFRFLATVAVWLGLTFLVATRLQAAGMDYEIRGNDLVVFVDARWAGCTQGGYYPIRIRLTNRGEDRAMTFRFVPNKGGLPTVVRTVQADQNATLNFTLSVPMVGRGSYGELQILGNGRLYKDLTRQVSLAGTEYNQFERPALLVVSPVNVNCDFFEQAVDSLRVQIGGGGGGYVRYAGSMRTSDHVVLPPVSLPHRWIDYSGLDIVAISLDTLTGLDREHRDAILAWVDCGGTLLLFDVGEPVTQSQALADLMQIDPDDPSAAWTPANPATRRAVQHVELDRFGNPTAAVPGSTQFQRDQEARQQLEQERANAWSAEPETFQWHPKMLGAVYAFPGDPFPGTIHDWDWFLRSLGPVRMQWAQRHGFSARVPRTHSEFISFLIPGVRGVPVYAFLVLMTVFTIVIGPLNYVMLLRRRRLYLLLVTIPLIALFTTVSLFGYSIVAHGFSVKSRTRSLTMLDQRTKTAVTTSRLALYAGLAPSGGLRFSPDTAIYPLQAPVSSFESGHVDWTETQSLDSGWLKSRTRTQYATVAHRPARGRLAIEPVQGGRLKIGNGLEWDLEALVVADDAGSLYYGADIPAGSGTELTTAVTDDLKNFVRLLARYPLEPPPAASLEPDTFLVGMSAGYSPHGPGPATKFTNGQMEIEIKHLQALDRREELAPRTYAAVLKHNPDVELGLEGTDEQAGYHVLIGQY